MGYSTAPAVARGARGNSRDLERNLGCRQPWLRSGRIGHSGVRRMGDMKPVGVILVLAVISKPLTPR
jgi:hypothetical protein